MPGGGQLTIETTTSGSTRTVARSPAAPAAGAYVALVGLRHRLGHGRRDAGAHLRAVLHDEGDGQGHGPGARDGLRHRQAERRRHLRRRASPARARRSRSSSARSRARGDAATRREPVGASRRRRQETVLLVEDEDGLRALSGRVLEATATACSRRRTPPRRSLPRRAAAGPTDLLVTDVVMPGMSGPRARRAAARSASRVRVLYISGYAEDVCATASSRRRRFLQKPFTPEGLSERVAELLTTELRRS